MDFRTRGGRAGALAAALIFCSVTLTACGSDSGDSGSLTQITVGLGGNIFDIPQRVAEEKGFYRRQGLDAKFVTLTGSTFSEALQSGSVDFLNDSPTAFVEAVDKGADQKAIDVDAIGAPLGLIVGKKYAAAHGITAHSSPAQVAKALVGSTAGTSSATTKGQAGIYLQANGVDPSGIKFVNLLSTAADKASLRSGQIDWFVTSEPIPLEVQESGDGIVAVGPDTVPQWSDSQAGYGQVVVAQTSYLAAHPGIAKKVSAATQQATNYLRGHQKELLGVAAQALPGVSDSVLARSMALVDWPGDGRMSTAEWNRALAFIRKQSAATKNLKVSDGDWTNEYLP